MKTTTTDAWRWRRRIEDEITRARELGKEPRAEPHSEEEWEELRRRFPSSLYAAWFVLTGRAPRNA